MAVLHKTRNEVMPSTLLGNFPMRVRVFPGCKMAASTVYKHRVLGIAILHPGNIHALIGKFCNYVLGKTSFQEWIYGDWSPYIQSPCIRVYRSDCTISDQLEVMQPISSPNRHKRLVSLYLVSMVQSLQPISDQVYT